MQYLDSFSLIILFNPGVDFSKHCPKEVPFRCLVQRILFFSYRIINYLFMKIIDGVFYKAHVDAATGANLMHSRNIGFLTFKTAAATNLGDTSLRKRLWRPTVHKFCIASTSAFTRFFFSSCERLKSYSSPDSSPNPVQLNQHGTHIISGMNLGFKYVRCPSGFHRHIIGSKIHASSIRLQRYKGDTLTGLVLFTVLLESAFIKPKSRHQYILKVRTKWTQLPSFALPPWFQKAPIH